MFWGLLLFLGLSLAMLIALEFGRRVGRAAFAADSGRRPAGLSAVEAVCFGVLGLLLAFTFSGAGDRLDKRRAQIVEEANDIGTAWLRVDLVPLEAQPALRDAMRRYVDARISTYRTFSTVGLEAARAEYNRSSDLQKEVWAKATDACRGNTQASLLLLPALNAMFDIASTRFAATLMHPPIVIYVVLEILSLACGFLVGYEMGASTSASISHVVVLTLLLSVVLYMILDFEYPRLGIMRIEHFDQLLVNVRTWMG
jgi:hypothetical protein